MEDRLLDYSRAWLAYAEQIRRRKSNHMAGNARTRIDHLVSMTFGCRLLTEAQLDRPVTKSRLVSDVAPELVAQATAHRYLKHYEQVGYIEVEQVGKYQLVRLTELGEQAFCEALEAGIGVLDSTGFRYTPNFGPACSVFWVSADMRILDVHNPELFGYGKDELIGTDPRKVNASQSDADQWTKIQLPIILRGQIHAGVWSAVKKDGTVVKMYSLTTCERWENGEEVMRSEHRIIE